MKPFGDMKKYSIRNIRPMTETQAKAHILALRPDWREEDIEITKETTVVGKPHSNILIRFTHKGEKRKYSSRPALVWDID